jgi:hypothetical protein
MVTMGSDRVRPDVSAHDHLEASPMQPEAQPPCAAEQIDGQGPVPRKTADMVWEILQLTGIRMCIEVLLRPPKSLESVGVSLNDS